MSPSATRLLPRPSPAPRALPAGRLAMIAAALLAASSQPARTQAIHRGTGTLGTVTQTVAFVDAWEDGGSRSDRQGTRDVLIRLETASSAGTRTAVQLVLYGPWGQHMYAFDEDRVTPGMPDGTQLRTTLRAMDLDDDGQRELVLIERTLTTRLALDDSGVPEPNAGPFFADATVKLRFLSRKDGALIENQLDPDPESHAMKELLQLELGGPINAWIQLAAADADFVRERFEQARYRHGIVREWAERQMTGREILDLSPKLPLLTARVDDAAVLWLAATRRIGALPRWYQRR